GSPGLGLDVAGIPDAGLVAVVGGAYSMTGANKPLLRTLGAMTPGLNRRLPWPPTPQSLTVRRLCVRQRWLTGGTNHFFRLTTVLKGENHGSAVRTPGRAD